MYEDTGTSIDTFLYKKKAANPLFYLTVTKKCKTFGINFSTKPKGNNICVPTVYPATVKLANSENYFCTAGE